MINTKFSVIVLSEIWSYNLDFYHNLLPGYSFYYAKPTGTNIGGVGIYIDNNFNHIVLDQYKLQSNESCMCESLFVEISCSTTKYIIGGIYRHPNQNIALFNQLLEPILTSIRKNRCPCIIAGDLNIDLCKYSTHNDTAEYVNNLLVNNFIPTIIMPTRITTKSATIIDHIFYYDGCHHNKQLSLSSGSFWCDITDHLPNYLIISKNKPVHKEYANRPFIRINSQKNTQTFINQVRSTCWNDVSNSPDVNLGYNLFESKLNKCFNDSFKPTRISRQRCKDKPWITSGLKKSSAIKNKLYKQWIKTKKNVDEIRYKNYRKVFKSLAKSAENLYYEEMFNIKTHSIKQLWANLNTVCSISKHKVKQNINKIKINNTEVNNIEDICNHFNDYFSTIGSSLAKNFPVTTDYKKYCVPAITQSIYLTPVTAEEIIRMVTGFKINKSPGPDDISPRILKLVIDEIADALAHLYNLSFSTGTVPESLKTAKVIPLYKKGDLHEISNYRPISLLSIFDKILEKLMHRRLINFLNKHHCLCNCQYGFRKNHSTILALTELMDNIYSHLDKKDIIAGIYLDLQKAFDTVDHEIHLDKLLNYGIRGTPHDQDLKVISHIENNIHVTIANDRYNFKTCNNMWCTTRFCTKPTSILIICK